MDASDTGTSEIETMHGADQSHDSNRSAGKPLARRTIRTLLAVEATSFFLAATVHAGVLVSGYEHYEAMVAEIVIGVVLLAGLATTWVSPRSTFSTAAVVQAFALLGTFVGLWTILVGVGPRTVPDVVYHVLIVVVLGIGLVLAWRSRGSEPR